MKKTPSQSSRATNTKDLGQDILSKVGPQGKRESVR